MDDSGTKNLVVLLGDPGGRKGGKGGNSGTTSPDLKFTIITAIDSDLRTSRGIGDDLGLKAVSEAFVHGRTTGEDYVLGQLLSNVNAGGLDRFTGELMDSSTSLSEEAWLEEKLWACHAD